MKISKQCDGDHYGGIFCKVCFPDPGFHTYYNFGISLPLAFHYQFRICLELTMIYYLFILVSCTTGFYESLLCWHTERMQK